MNCKNCQEETSKPKFCSRSCAATYNNKIYPKKTKKTVDGPQTCIDCDVLSTSENSYPQRDKFSSRCKTCQRAYNQHHSHQMKRLLVDKCGGKCSICGYDKNYAALQFHHRDPSTKEFTIAAKHWGDDNMFSEIEKCDLICGNCHAEIHHPALNKTSLPS